MNSSTWKIRIGTIAIIAILAACTTDSTRRGYMQIAATLDEPSHPVIVIPGFGVSRLFDPVTRRCVWVEIIFDRVRTVVRPVRSAARVPAPTP